MLAIVKTEKKRSALRKEPTKGYMTAIVPKLKPLAVSLLLSISC